MPDADAAADNDPREPAPPRSGGLLTPLDAVAAEIEAHLARDGWDRPPALFALVPTAVAAADPETARLLGLTPEDDLPADSLTPFAQDQLPDVPLDEALAGIEWPETVAGCAFGHEIVILPPDAEGELTGGADDLALAASHPRRREARLVVAVTRTGHTAGVLRLRATADEPDELAFGADLAPNLAAALRATLD